MRFTLIAMATLGQIGLAHAETTTCDPSRVMVLFDRSTSMRDGYIDAKSKWDIATAALKGVVQDYQGKAELGLSVFPEKAGDCAAGALAVVDPPKLAGSLMAISDGLTANKTGSNLWTPLGQAVKEMSTLTSLKDASKRRFLVVVSDGAQSCPASQSAEQSKYLDANRANLAAEVTTLRNLGVKVFVIGFGDWSIGGAGNDKVDPLALNQMAWAGGTARPGCDPRGATLPANNLCYYQANNAAELAGAFDEIAVTISNEICDGVDNNCDGNTDEDLTRPCASACGAGTETCSMGDWSACTAPSPNPEICDAYDNNCDGVTDEGCDCTEGQTVACGSDVGECAPGTQSCVNGLWGACQGETGPRTEICDGLDNDCDGKVDPSCDCVDGRERACGGPAVGECRVGRQTCADGKWGDCTGSVGPLPEICDGRDNDCDGVVDEEVVNTEGEGAGAGVLCPDGQLCIDGKCTDVPSSPPSSGPGQVGTGKDGCGCHVGHASDGNPLAALALVGLAALFLRRRRRA